MHSEANTSMSSQTQHLKPARVNLAILTYNALDYTKMCLESIARNTRADHNIFVLDNGSTDGSREWLKHYKAANFYSEEAVKNSGVPGGRNRLIEIISPLLPEDGFVVFLDNDMELKEGWDTQYLSFFEDHPEAGIASAFGHRMIVRKYHRELLPAPSYTAPVDVACGGFACWIRAKALQAVGGFDENLGLFWHEDDDFSLRTIAAGWDVYALPHVSVVHHEHKSGAANPGIKSGGSPKNQIYLCEKWRNLGLVDSQGRIVRAMSKDVVTPTKALDLGGFQWLRPESTLVVPSLPAGAAANSFLSFSLGCARKEFYDSFPFSVEVSSAAGSMRFTFSSSDETHQVCVQGAPGSEVHVRSSASFSPALSGLGAHCQGALAVRLSGWQGSPTLKPSVDGANVETALEWISSVFDTDRYAELSQFFVPALQKRFQNLSVRALTLNESIVAELQNDRAWLSEWQTLLKKSQQAKVCIAATDPLAPDGQSRFRWIREQNPALERLIGFVLVESPSPSPAWVESAKLADELWVLSDREKKILVDCGIPSSKVMLVPIGVSEEFLARSDEAAPVSLIDGRVCFLAQVDSIQDPFLATCVRAVTTAFSKEDGVALLVSVSPTGAQLPAEYIKSLVGSVDFNAEARAPVFTISPYSAPSLRRKVFDAVHCFLVSSPSQRRLEVLEAMASGVPTIYLSTEREACEVLSLSSSKESLLTLGLHTAHESKISGSRAVESLVTEMRRVHAQHAALRTAAVGEAWASREGLSQAHTVRWIEDRLVQKVISPAVAETAPVEKAETVIREDAKPLLVGIDARTLTYAETRERGIGHYTVNHLAEIFRQRPEWNFILYRNEAESSEALEKLLEHRNVRLGVMGEQNRDDLDLYHIADPMTILPGFDSPFLAAPDVPSTAVFYDLIPLVKREMHFDCWENWTKKSYLRRLSEMKRSQVIALPISECSRVDLHRLAEFPLERAVTIMAGVNRAKASGAPSPDALRQVQEKFGLNSPFFLSVGGLDGHKGFMATAQAYASLRSSRNFQFAVVGSLNDPYKASYRKLFEANKIPGVVFTGYLSREEMACLYALSSGLVFPSHYEGFGFPVLEAMAYGCPVITTKVSSLPEVAGDAGILVGVDDAKGIEEAMRRLLDEPELRAQMSKRGLEQAAKFSWETCAQKTIEVWLNLLGAQSGVESSKDKQVFRSPSWS